MLQEPGATTDISNALPMSCSLKDVFDLVLSTCSNLRHIARRQTPRYSRPTLLFVATVTRYLCRTLSDDISLVIVVYQTLPTWGANLSENSPDGHATLIALHTLISSAYSLGNEVETDSQGDDMDEYSSKVTAFSLKSIDVPLEAHLLVGRGLRVSGTSLLSSVVYQRRVCGIYEPAVGVIFSKSSTIGQVVFAWLDVGNDLQDDLPSVRLGFAANSFKPGISLGIFDLAIPVGTFAFAQFLLSLQPHYHATADASSIEVVNSRLPFSWRSYLIMPEPSYEEQWKDKVLQT
ncbi:hypothetical protein BDN67DRAFT_82000 [Paxillus ammoniavirescens]|nr:hypothetical protein BDN67DRAFT_82000 [Paxillus ammoniavirescens]